MKTRSYYKTQSCIEEHIYQGVKLVAHLVYYPAKGYYCPRYHFENFNLLLPELNYEITRFMHLVNKVVANPAFDLENYDYSEDLRLEL